MVIIHKVPLSPPVREGLTRPTLTEEQQAKYDIVLAHFSDAEYRLPDIEGEKAALIEKERFWLTRECLLRYLRATKWVETDAITRLADTLKWRREFGLNDLVTPEYVEPEGLTGKNVVWGYDVDGRPAQYMLPSRQNTDGSTPEGQRRQLQYAIFMMERAFDLAGPGVENIALMIDYSDRAKSPSIGTARYMLSYLQNHYPERLGRALIINLPWLATMFFKVMMPLLDPVTRAKVRFNPQIVQDGLFAADETTIEWGGEVQIPYEHETYWPALIKLCTDRRDAQMQRWHELGGTVGLSEWDIRQPSSSEKVTTAAEKAVAPAHSPAPEPVVVH